MTAHKIRPDTSAARQQGAVLFVALIFLLVLTLLGVMLARMQTTEERMAQNDANHDIALEAAGAALRYAEMNLDEGNYVNFSQNANGLYTLNPNQPGWYSQIDWQSPGTAVLPYGGPQLSSVASQPNFIVVQLPSVAKPGASLGAVNQGYGANGSVQVFQITAVATGGDRTGTSTLRSIYETE